MPAEHVHPAGPPAGPSAVPPAQRDGEPLPLVIQGGMGVAVSGWRLARAVAETGQLGVVSGTALDLVLARRLQDGDAGGHAREALAHLPLPEVAERVLRRYYLPGGRRQGRPYRPIPRLRLDADLAADELAVAGNFVEVFLARAGHDGPVGVNYLEKIQMALPAAMYGAVLAGADYLLVGAGIPAQVPALATALAQHQPFAYRVEVEGREEPAHARFDPAALVGREPGTGVALPPLARPRVLAIVSSPVLAAYLARDPVTCPDGFVVEHHRAGGHSAPPRGRLALTDDGQPRYGPRDEADPAALAKLDLPFWLAGGQAGPGRLREALAAGATGVQIGTAFALCAESGLLPERRAALLADARAGQLEVRNEPFASPTGFPFKVAQVDDTLSDAGVYAERERLCDLGYLRVPYERPNGEIGYRCSAEPEHVFVRKGGTAEAAAGRRCLCNGLLATIGLAQTRPDGYVEPPVLTLGQDLSFLPELAPYGEEYGAADVVRWLLSGVLSEVGPSGLGPDSRAAGRP